MIAFLATLRDPDTGKTRDVTIEITAGALLVRLGRGRTAEDAPHHTCADFTEQRVEIAAAIVDANEEHETTKGPTTT